MTLVKLTRKKINKPKQIVVSKYAHVYIVYSIKQYTDWILRIQEKPWQTLQESFFKIFFKWKKIRNQLSSAQWFHNLLSWFHNNNDFNLFGFFPKALENPKKNCNINFEEFKEKNVTNYHMPIFWKLSSWFQDNNNQICGHFSKILRNSWKRWRFVFEESRNNKIKIETNPHVLNILRIDVFDALQQHFKFWSIFEKPWEMFGKFVLKNLDYMTNEYYDLQCGHCSNWRSWM